MAGAVSSLSDLNNEEKADTMRKRWVVPVLVVAVLVVVAVIFWPWWRSWLPHPALLEAWINYLVIDLNIGRWGPVATFLLVGVIELVWALNLGRRSGAFERQWKRLERLHAKEVEVLGHEISLLEDERRALRAELDLHEDLVREEKVRLWTHFEELQRAGNVPQGRLIGLDVPNLSPELRGEWRQIISQLERIEVANMAANLKSKSVLQLQRQADDLLRLGNSCYYLEQYERALTHYGRAIDLAAVEPEAFINHAVVNLVLHRYPQALLDLDHALKLGENAWAYLYRGLIREQLGEEKRAMEDYARAVRLDSRLVEAQYRRGLLYAKMGEFDKALQDQNRVLELEPNHAGGYTARGVAQAALGDSQWALNDLDKGCALAPQRHEGFYQRGRVRHELEMYDAAVADFSQAIELAPDFAPGFTARGNTYLILGEHWQAAADFGRVIELQPKNAEAYCARGMSRAALREYRRAIEDYDQALELDPTLAAALANRGSAYEKLGEYEPAIRDLDRAIALDPNLAIAYYNRGLAYGSQGEYDRASRDLNKAVELDPSLNNRENGALGMQTTQVRHGA
jgi:tetratricopeptide (TPR) repeat protein